MRAEKESLISLCSVLFLRIYCVDCLDRIPSCSIFLALASAGSRAPVIYLSCSWLKGAEGWAVPASHTWLEGTGEDEGGGSLPLPALLWLTLIVLPTHMICVLWSVSCVFSLSLLCLIFWGGLYFCFPFSFSPLSFSSFILLTVSYLHPSLLSRYSLVIHVLLFPFYISSASSSLCYFCYLLAPAVCRLPLTPPSNQRSLVFFYLFFPFFSRFRPFTLSSLIPALISYIHHFLGVSFLSFRFFLYIYFSFYVASLLSFIIFLRSFVNLITSFYLLSLPLLSLISIRLFLSHLFFSFISLLSFPLLYNFIYVSFSHLSLPLHLFLSFSLV